MITKVRSRIQDAVDAVVAAAMAVAGVTMIIGYAQAQAIIQALAYYGSLAWAVVLTAASVATLAGVVLRPVGKGFGLELAGWGFVAGAVALYTIFNAWAGGSAPGVAALVALTALLTGKFLRGTASIRTARQHQDNP